MVICGILRKEKAVHIATGFGIEYFKAPDGWISSLKQKLDVLYKSVCVESANGGLQQQSNAERTVIQNF